MRHKKVFEPDQNLPQKNFRRSVPTCSYYNKPELKEQMGKVLLQDIITLSWYPKTLNVYTRLLISNLL